MRQGQLISMPRGTPHTMFSDRQAKVDELFGLPVQHLSDRYETLRHGGDGD